MIKKTITYVDYEGESRTEDFYFHLTQRDLLKMQTEYPGGLHKFLMKIVAENNQQKIFEYMEDIIQRSYGEKSADGRRFITGRDDKNVLYNFIQTEAYSQLVMELATNADAAAEFINGIIPEGLNKQAAAATN
jgi:hypothetical protein